MQIFKNHPFGLEKTINVMESFPEDYQAINRSRSIIMSLATDLDNMLTLEEEESKRFKNGHLIITTIFVCMLIFIFNILIEKISLQRILYKFFVISFFCSMFWNYKKEYNKNVARQYTILQKGTLETCSLHKYSFWDLWNSWFFIKYEDDDHCFNHAYATILEPIYETSPMDAFLVTTSSLILRPIEEMSKSINVVFKNLFKDIPISMSGLYLLTAIIIYLMVGVSCKKIKVPFISSIADTVVNNNNTIIKNEKIKND